MQTTVAPWKIEVVSVGMWAALAVTLGIVLAVGTVAIVAQAGVAVARFAVGDLKQRIGV